MEKKVVNKTIYFILIIIFALMSRNAFADASNDIQKNIRVGLVYNKKPANTIAIACEKGIDISESKAEVETNLFSKWTKNNVIITSNTYYKIENNQIKPITNQGLPITNWHIVIGDKTYSYFGALKELDIYKSEGLESFLYYDGNWKVFTGIYDSFESAQFEMDKIQKKYPKITFNVQKSGDKALLMLDDEKKPMVVFDKNDFELSIKPKPEGVLKINDSEKTIYRGSLLVYRLSDGFKVVNKIPMEQYLYGVVPAEIGIGAPFEALKAQTIAARNYTYNSLGKHNNEGFDTCDATNCQVYKGKSVENENINKAVDETFGQLLKYDGKIASVFYFSSTGGEKTEDVSNVWGSSIPYLVSVDSNYETDKSWNAVWTVSLSNDKIKSYLADRNVDIGDITDIIVSKRSEAGRVVELKVRGQKGEKIFTKESARTVFGLSSQHYQVISSENFVVRDSKGINTRAINGCKIITSKGIKELSTKEKEITIKSSTKSIQKKINSQNFTFTGKGWGHAVGLSQDGAIGMANAGFTYDKILTHYFKGTYVE